MLEVKVDWFEEVHKVINAYLDQEVLKERERIIRLIKDYWTFDEFQKPTSGWHEKNDLLDEVRGRS